MLKFSLSVIVVLASVYFAWPYAYVYRIDTALTRGDRETLTRLVDMGAVRDAVEKSLSRDLNDALGSDNTGVVGWIKNQVNDLGAAAVDEVITLDWVAETLKPGGVAMRSRITHAAFEGWDVFVVRLGELGNNPVHVKLGLTHGNWRIVAVYP